MNNKLEAISNLFEDKEIRSIWDAEKEDYYFSVIDVISVLTESNDPSHYWRTLKSRMIKEGNETVTNCDTFKLKAKDGKMRNTDMLDTKGIFRLIESVPSQKAEPFKIWLANLGSERIDEVFDPEIAVNRAVNYYRNKGYTDEWIKRRLTGIVDRFKLTDVWKEGGITKPIEYALLTNEIYKGWSGMKASEYKAYKGLRKESLRDNMTDIEIALTNIGEIAARDIAREEHPQGLNENLHVAKRGGNVAKGARDLYEIETKKSAISNKNALSYKYIDEVKQIEDKVGVNNE
ncbi:MAG: phage antirepressor protein [Bacilli bacterium]|nr:phage antirepressor protein [Bacilli bacterium]